MYFNFNSISLLNRKYVYYYLTTPLNIVFIETEDVLDLLVYFLIITFY